MLLSRINLTEKDFEYAKILYEGEKIHPVNEENMFRAALYCVLSAAEKYKKHREVYETLLEAKLDTPKKIKANKEKLRNLIRKIRFPNLKTERIYNFALWWLESSLPREILEDIESGRRRGFELRNRLAEEAPGIGYKGASLFMVKCGYQDVVPIDIHMMRFLYSLGFDIEIPDYRRKSGPSPKVYLEYERIISEIAKKFDITPALFQFTVWHKSTLNGRR